MKKTAAVCACAAAAVLFAGCLSTGAAAGAEKGDEFVEAVLPAGEVKVLDDFEEGNYWFGVGDTWDQWGSHNFSLEAEITDKWGTNGPNSGEWLYAAGTGDSSQATFCCDQMAETDWTGAKYVAIDFNNVESFPIMICFNSQSTDGWNWTNTKAVIIPPGPHLAVFNIQTGTTDGSNVPTKGIVGVDKMKRGMFTVLGKTPGGRLLADNFRLIY